MIKEKKKNNHRPGYGEEYYEKNRDRILKYQKEWRKTHPGEPESHKKWNNTATGIYSKLKRRTKSKGNPELVNIIEEDFIEWYRQQEQKCFYCGRTLGQIQNDETQFKGRAKRLQIDRIDSNKGYEINNIVLACPRCNSIKNNFFTKDEMLKIVNVFKYKFS